jgi:threonine dehydratase
MIPLKQIEHAAEVIRDRILKTPLVHSPTFSRMFDADVFLKLENLQKTGSFKIRGAANRILGDMEKIGPAGVVAASAGNHAQGVAFAAKAADMSSTIVMPEWASISKQEATRGYGGEVILFGQSLEESLRKAMEIAEEGKTFIHPFDDVDVIAGQGTVALEIFQQLPDPDMILVPVGGGGLISGVASAACAIRSKTRIIGVQTASCPSAVRSLEKGSPIRVAAVPSIADGISVKQIGETTFGIIRDHVDQVVLAEEEQIAAAILMLLERKKILAEGAGAVCLAALIGGSIRVPKGTRVVLVVSGGNLDSPLLGRIISQGLIKHERVMRFRVRLEDTPGSLSRLLSRIAGSKANVLHIYHDRNVKDLPLYVTRVGLELETRGAEHVEEIRRELERAGYQLEII